MFKLGQTNPNVAQKGALINISELDIDNSQGGRNVLLLIPYGMQMNEPSTPILAITGKLINQSDNQFTFVTDTNNRDSQSFNGLPLAAGEISIGIPSLKTRLHFLADGTAEIILKGQSGIQTTPDYFTKFTEMQTAFNQLKSDFNSLVTAYNTHTHILALSSGTGTAAPTVTSGTSSSASMSNAKLAGLIIPNV